MKIGGFQKFSLLDYPGKLAALVFTQGCNFRCPYCHNPQLVDPERYTEKISEDEVLEFLYSRKGKLTAVSISGGEPTLQVNLIPFMKRLKAMGYAIKLDTNGSRPEVLKEIIKQQLVDYWAMDIKAPLKLYKTLTRSDIDENSIARSMHKIRHSGKLFEFRTTFFELLFNWNDVRDIQDLLKPGDIYYLQQCKYNDTLEEMRTNDNMEISLADNTYIHLIDHPACRNLIEWGHKRQIQISIRSL